MSSQIARRKKRLIGKTSWSGNGEKPPDILTTYQAKGQNKGRNANGEKPDERMDPEVESITFVPHTPGGILRNTLSQMEEKKGLNGRIKYVDKLRSSLKELLSKSNPWTSKCGR